MSDFLFLLARLNLALAGAILMVWLLRRPLRASFGAPIAYALWLLVPIAMLASLLPPRLAAVAPVHLTPRFAHLAHIHLNQAPYAFMPMAEPGASHSAVHAVIATHASVALDTTFLLFLAWACGAGVMALSLARLQQRFSAAARLGQAGPAVLGVLRPRIVLPDSFRAQFTPPEQAAILAHERVHIARQDARTNAASALLRCLCWFNPLIHLGAKWLRIDQELACDATVVAGPVSRRDYANALVKSQLVASALPLGCNWPGSPHPLIERIALLKRKHPTNARRITGIGLIALAAASAGLYAQAVGAAWGAQPPAVSETGIRMAMAQAQSLASAIAQPRLAHPSPDADFVPPGARPLRAGNLIVRAPKLSRLLPAAPELTALADEPSDTLPEDKMLKQSLAASVALIALNTTPHLQTAAAQTPMAQLPAAAQPATGRTCPLPSLVDKAALEQVPGSDLMTVAVAINGTPKKFLLDIGTNMTEVSQAAVTQLGLPENSKVTENIGALNGSDMTPQGGDLSRLTNGGLGGVALYDVRDRSGIGATQTRVRVGAFTVGNATGKRLQFLVANDALMGSRDEPYDGLLTGDFFRQYDVEMDFGGHAIYWLTPANCTDPNQVVFWPHAAVAVIPMSYVDGKITVPVTVQGHQINAVIDTSSSRTVMRRDIAELIVGLRPGRGDTMPVEGLTDGKGQPVYGHTFSQIQFAGGSVTASNVPALILTNSLTHEMNSHMVLGSWARSADARPPDLTLGMDVLHQLHLYVMPGQKTLYITSAE